MNYTILAREDENVPAFFEPILESENYIVYKNQLPLPFVRSASSAYSEESLAGAPGDPPGARHADGCGFEKSRNAGSATASA
nr:hypothetical protein [Planococcus salinarum]